MGQVLTQNIQVERSTKQQVQTVVVHSSSGSFKSTISVSKEPQLSNFNDSLSLIMTALSFIDMEWCSMSLFTAISIDQSFLQCSQTKDKWEKKTILYDCGTSISRISISFCIIFCKNVYDMISCGSSL